MKKTPQPRNEIVYESVDELADELHVSRQAVYQGLRSGTIPAIRLNKRFIIPRAAIAEWLRTADHHPALNRSNIAGAVKAHHLM